MTRRVTATIAICMFLGQPALAQEIDSLEKAVKATYLYKFGAFVDWPDYAFALSDDFYLCVAGDDPFGATLDRAVQGQQVKGRPITVRRIQIAERDSHCHIMFIAGSSVQSVAEGIAAVSGTPTLTITDESRDANAKGIIHFVIRDNRVRFEIDDQVAAANGLTISSKVLSLAVSVKARS